MCIRDRIGIPVVQSFLKPAMDSCTNDRRPWVLTDIDLRYTCDAVSNLTITGAAYLRRANVGLERTWCPSCLPHDDFGQLVSENFREAVCLILNGLNHEATGVS